MAISWRGGRRMIQYGGAIADMTIRMSQSAGVAREKGK